VIFLGRVLPRWFKQVILAIRETVGLKSTLPAPTFDAVRGYIQLLGHFCDGEHSGQAQAFIATLESIVPAEALNQPDMERPTPARLPSLRIEPFGHFPRRIRSSSWITTRAVGGR
jgi:hypothetical protein